MHFGIETKLTRKKFKLPLITPTTIIREYITLNLDTAESENLREKERERERSITRTSICIIYCVFTSWLHDAYPRREPIPYKSNSCFVDCLSVKYRPPLLA